MIILKACSGSADTAARVIAGGGIAVLPTDTVYGFSGAVPDSKRKIVDLKKRDISKDFIRLIAHPSDIFRYTASAVPESVLKLWPCALTLIVRLKDGTGTGAFRCPGDEWLRSVVEKAGRAVYSTSVNYSGSPVFTDIAAIRAEFEDKVDLIVDAGDLSGAVSTIADLTAAVPSVIREGAVKLGPAFYV